MQVLTEHEIWRPEPFDSSHGGVEVAGLDVEVGLGVKL